MSRTQKTLFFLSFLISPVFLFFPYLMGWKLLGGLDFEDAYLPWQLFLSNQIRHGHLPFWNPFFSLGRPTFAEVENSLLYPMRWILFWNPAYTISIFLAAHFSIAHWGGFRLASRFDLSRATSWIVGFATAFNGWMFAHVLANHAFILASVAWALHFTSDLISDGWKSKPRKWATLLFFEGVFLTQSGSPQLAYYSIVFAGTVMLVFRPRQLLERRFWLLGLIAGVGTALVALPHYWFAAELHSISHRAGVYPWEKAIQFILSPNRIAELWAGPSLEWIQRNESTVFETGIYIGPVVVLFAALECFINLRTAWRWGLLAVLFFALGMVTPELVLKVFRFLPGAASFRSPGRFMLFGLYSISMIFGLCADEIVSRVQNTFRPSLQYFLRGGLALSVMLPLLIHGMAYLPKATDRHAEALSKIAEVARKETGEARPRVLLDLGPVFPNHFWEHGIEMIPGRSAIYLWRFQQFLMPVVPVEPYDVASYFAVPARKQSLMSLLSAPVVATTLPPEHMKYFRFLTKVPPYDLYWDDTALPKVQFFSSGTAVHDRFSDRDLLWKSTKPYSELFYEGPKFADLSANTRGDCSYDTPTFEQWKIHCKTSGPGIVWVSQVFYPGWKALVNGREESIFPANVLFQSIHVPAGEVEIDLRYDTRKIKFLLALAFLTMSVFVVASVVKPKRV